MKKVFFTAFFVLIFAVSCSNNSEGVYDGFEDDGSEGGDAAETSDDDSEKIERPDEAGYPGGASGSESGTPSGSSGSKDDDQTADDSEPEPGNDDEETPDDDEGGTSDDDGVDPETPDENGDDVEPVPDEDDAEIPDDDGGVYALQPDVGACTSGIPSDSDKQKVLDRVNYIRSIHKLPPVYYDDSGDEVVAECSLVIAANKQLSHTPDNSWECWSQEAYDGCHSSNIFIQWANYDISSLDSAEVVDSFLTDENVETLGHRRWLIDPWLAHISFGRADDTENFVVGSAIQVINDEQQDISDTELEYVAYPFENYPAKLYNDEVMMSFTVIKDKSNKYANGTNINLASAAVAIISPDNKTMKVKNILFDTDGYGVPNNLRWFAEGIQPNVKYNVTVSNIMVNDVSQIYQYWFELK